MPFFTAETALRRRFEQTARQRAFTGTTVTEAATWQTDSRAHFAHLLGLHRMTPAAPCAEQLGSVTLDDGLTRESWRIQTEADIWMPFEVIVPRDGTGPFPTVLCPHGHASAGKWAVAGMRLTPEVEQTIDEHHYDYGLQFARAGCLAICPDARGFGERREPALQHERHLLNSSCHHLTLAGTPLGLTVQGMWTFDLMRLVDWLLTQERVDSDRLGVAGLSGGGMQSLDLAACDTRIRAAIVSGYFYGVRESLQVQNGHCMCNLVPGLWEAFDMGDIGALIAGRSLCIETGDTDSLNGASGLGNVTPQLGYSARVFALLGGALEHVIFSGPHRWDGVRSIPWLIARLTG